MKFKAFFIFLLAIIQGNNVLFAQAAPSHTNVTASQSEIEQNSIFMDPVFGYGENENLTNFNSRNFWFRMAESAPNDTVAWFNYYRSTRYIAEGSAGFDELQKELDLIDEHMRNYVPGTWEQLIVDYWNSNRDVSKNASLEAAFKLRPDDPITLRFMIGKEYLSGQMVNAFRMYSNWKATGDAPQSTEGYAYNVMQSLPKDAILFTNGEMDTYPLLFQLQQAGNASVKLISISFCSRSANRTTLFQNAGIALPDNDASSPIDSEYIRRVSAANPGKKIYVASTCGGELLSGLSAQLYCTGLAFRFSAEPLDHLNFLRDNVGVKMKLAGVGKAVKSKHHFDLNYASKLEMNYYLPLLIAADSYATAGNPTRAKELRTKAKAIRVRAGYDEPIRNEGPEE